MPESQFLYSAEKCFFPFMSSKKLALQNQHFMTCVSFKTTKFHLIYSEE